MQVLRKSWTCMWALRKAHPRYVVRLSLDRGSGFVIAGGGGGGGRVCR